MIVVRLMGGLGNQMFQYAIGKSLSLSKSTELLLDRSFLDENIHRKDFTVRNYMLDIFKVPEQFASPFLIEKLKKSEPTLLCKIKFKVEGAIIPYYKYPYIIEKQFNYDSNIINCSNKCLLEGYWQTDKYFNNIHDQLKNVFNVRIEPTDKNREILNEILTTESVGLHIRRQDYVTNNRTNQIHGICSLQYYYDALEIIVKKIPNISVFIISDDIEWAKLNFVSNLPITFIEGNEKLVHEDFRHLYSCKHNIIANSSFSWWAAWLNNNPAKIVIAPRHWFNDLSINTIDLIPKEWITI